MKTFTVKIDTGTRIEQTEIRATTITGAIKLLRVMYGDDKIVGQPKLAKIEKL